MITEPLCSLDVIWLEDSSAGLRCYCYLIKLKLPPPLLEVEKVSIDFDSGDLFPKPYSFKTPVKVSDLSCA